MNNRISFKSNINFVSIESFKKIRNGEFLDFRDNFINAVSSPEFYTESVMDCTAGGITDHKKKKSMGFHITGEYRLKHPPFYMLGKAKNGLILGSKKTKYSVNSAPNYETIKNFLAQKVQNLSVFGQYRHKHAMSDMHYSLKDDTWTICTIYYNCGFRNLKEVTTPKRLLGTFKDIKIAKGDRLFFEGKEVLPKDCPFIFESTNSNKI